MSRSVEEINAEMRELDNKLDAGKIDLEVYKMRSMGDGTWLKAKKR